MSGKSSALDSLSATEKAAVLDGLLAARPVDEAIALALSAAQQAAA